MPIITTGLNALNAFVTLTAIFQFQVYKVRDHIPCESRLQQVPVVPVRFLSR